jgi:hypothetical protein
MKSSMKIALIALAVGGSSLALSVPAMAADSVTVTTTTAGPGGIAFGYNDGYWDQAHSWHAWENEQAMTTYRTANSTHYYAYKHDRDPDAGWREKERYWDKH